MDALNVFAKWKLTLENDEQQTYDQQAKQERKGKSMWMPAKSLFSHFILSENDSGEYQLEECEVAKDERLFINL